MKPLLSLVVYLCLSFFAKGQPKDFNYYKSLGMVQLYERNFLEAVFNFEKAAALKPNDEEIKRFLLACQDSLGVRKIDGKLRLREKTHNDKTVYRPTVSIPNANIIDNKTPGVKMTYTRMLKADANLHKDALQLGHFFFERNSYDSAAYCYQRVVNRNANDTFAVYMLAVSKYFSKIYDEAKDWFGYILQIDNKRSDIYNWIGICDLLQGNYLAARDNFKQSLIADKTYYPAYYNLAKTQFELEDIGGATKNLEIAAELLPNDVDVKYLLAECYYRANQLNAAKKLFTDLYASNKNNLRINYVLGDIASRQSNWLQAVEYWSNYARLAPADAPLAYKKIGVAYYHLEKYTYSIENFDKASRAIWDDKDLLLNAAIACNKMGNYTKAIEYINRIMALDNRNPRIYYQIGIAYQGLGNKRMAKQNFQTARELEMTKVE